MAGQLPDLLEFAGAIRPLPLLRANVNFEGFYTPRGSGPHARRV
jgi:hypothetical protein